MRIADPNPPFCSVCYTQKPQMVHVDADAHYDGPMINTDDNIRMSIDDIKVCMECVVRMYEMLPDDKGNNPLLEMTRKAEGLRVELEQTRRYADQLETAFMAQPPERRTKMTKA